MAWQTIGIAVLFVAIMVSFAAVVWWRRSTRSREEALAQMREIGLDLVRLPGRLRRVAADPRTPRRARWWLLGLAIYVASPIDPIPDVIPVLGYADELIVVPIVLRHIRQMIPAQVWNDYFPPRSTPPEP